MNDHPPEVTDAFVEKLLRTIAEGPVGAMLQALAAGESRVVVKQNRSGEGWVIEVEPVKDEKWYLANELLLSRLTAPVHHRHVFNTAGVCECGWVTSVGT